MWIADLMRGWLDIKIRGIVGGDPEDLTEIVILGRCQIPTRGLSVKRILNIGGWRWRSLVLDETSKGLVQNYEKDYRNEDCDWEGMASQEATEFRGVAARMNFLGQDSQGLQYPVKECSRDMARPHRGAWRRAKKVARYLVHRTAVVWKYEWQEDTGESLVMSDRDWGNSGDRKSISGWV